jgi:DnaJ-class molecular chaperone
VNPQTIGNGEDVIYTHYDYLEIAPGVPRERIEAAYARVLERFNYGVSPNGQDLSGLVRMIHSAYQVLSDPESRRTYDSQLAREAHEADAELKAMLDKQCATLPRRVQDVPAPLNAVFTALAA